MSTELFDSTEDQIWITSYYGGKERGRCFQISASLEGGVREVDPFKYIQLTARQIRVLRDKLNELGSELD